MSPDETKGLTLEDSVATLLANLPGPVQAFVLGPDRPRIAIELSKKYNLHVDQAGALEQAFMYMLLGVSSPEEFVDALAKANIPAESVRGLTQDVNEQVFLPLRKAEQSGTPTAVRTVTATPPQILPGSSEPVPVVPPKLVAQQPAPAMPPPQIGGYPAMPQPMYGYIPQQMPPQMMYAPPYGMPQGYGAPVYMWPQQAPMQQWPQAPQQSQQFQPAPQAYIPPAPAVAISAPQARVVLPSPERLPIPAPQTQPRATLNPGAQIQKNYSADPYRESFAP